MCLGQVPPRPLYCYRKQKFCPQTCSGQVHWAPIERTGHANFSKSLPSSESSSFVHEAKALEVCCLAIFYNAGTAGMHSPGRVRALLFVCSLPTSHVELCFFALESNTCSWMTMLPPPYHGIDVLTQHPDFARLHSSSRTLWEQVVLRLLMDKAGYLPEIK